MPNKKRKQTRTEKRVAKLENEFAAIMSSLQKGNQPIVKKKTSNTYVATINFCTDRRLTQDEMDSLLFAAAVQIEDPSGKDGAKRAEFSTCDVKAMIKRTRKINRRKKIS